MARKLTKWNKFVKNVFLNGKKMNKTYSFRQALLDAKKAYKGGSAEVPMKKVGGGKQCVDASGAIQDIEDGKECPEGTTEVTSESPAPTTVEHTVTNQATAAATGLIESVVNNATKALTKPSNGGRRRKNASRKGGKGKKSRKTAKKH